MRAILTYHSVDGSGTVTSIEEAAFERHVRFLGSGRVRVVPLAELTAVDPAEDAVAITFDDGYRNFATVAWPRLKDAGLPVTLFVVTGRAGLDNRWDGAPGRGPVLELLDWDELGALAEQGVEIGSHGRSHARLPRLDDVALAAEIAGSAEDLAHRLGRRPGSFCYPYGDHDTRTVRLAEAAYGRACTTDLRPLRSSDLPHRLPRIDTYYLRRAGRLERYGGLGLRAYLGVRAAARRLRTARG